MDFQGFANTFAMPCAVLSVEALSNGHCGEVRIVKANDIYKERMGIARYHDGMIYSDLVPKDSKFEDFCYRAAVLKQKMHAYVETRGLNCWTDQTLIPLQIDDEKTAYCAFFFDFTRKIEPEKISTIKLETSAFVLENIVRLRNTPDFHEALNKVVSDLQKKTDSFSCIILSIDKLKKQYKILSEKFKKNLASVAEFSDALTYDVVNSWEKTIGKSNGVIVKDEYDMELLAEKNPLWAKSLKRAQVENFILFPLRQDSFIFGYLFITNYDTTDFVEKKELLESTAYFLSSEISNHDLMEKMEHLSTTDLLTGIKNRNAMNILVDRHINGSEKILAPYGIIFVDINGLKKANDTYGHEEGDNLIKSAAKTLVALFPDSEIFRAGGDEFVVLVRNLSKEDFLTQVSELKEETDKDSDVCLAVGYYWNEKNIDLRKAMHFADEEMYANKETFYKQKNEE